LEKGSNQLARYIINILSLPSRRFISSKRRDFTFTRIGILVGGIRHGGTHRTALPGGKNRILQSRYVTKNS